MPGQRPLLAMSFIASLGMTFEVLACTLPKGQGNFWPLLVFIFYVLLPLPTIISRRILKESAIGLYENNTAKVRDIALFLTTGIMVSSMALPIVMARSPSENPIIKPLPCLLVELGNLMCYATIALFCIYFKPISGF